MIYSEIVEISKLELKDFMTQTPVNKLLVSKGNLYFIFSNDKDRDVAYIFNVEYQSLKLKGYKKIDLADNGYYLNNTVIFLE